MKKKYNINFITLFLLFCTVYMGINATLNITKCISYNMKIAKLQKLHTIAQFKKTRLISEIEGYESKEKYEEFARNHLGYAAPNEIRLNLIPSKESPEEKLNICY